MRPTFYGKLYSESYDFGTDISEVTAFYLHHWQQLNQPNPVLEPMCGTGLNLIPFIKAGADIDGLDSSRHMLRICRQKLETQNLEADLYEQSIELMSLPRQYSFVFIPDGSFGHLYDLAIAQKCLEQLSTCLLPKGRLIFDVKSLSQLEKFPTAGQSSLKVHDLPDGSTIFETTVWGAVEDSRIIRCWNKIEHYVESRLVETEVFDYRERLYTRKELESMLKNVGFTIETVLKPYQHSESQDGDGFIFICNK